MDIISVSFPVSEIKFSEKSNVYVWAHIPMIQSIVVGKQEPGAVGYIAPTFRRQRAKNASTQLPFTLNSPGSLPGEWCHPQ